MVYGTASNYILKKKIFFKRVMSIHILHKSNILLR
jgi:hypothetical protein